jgi:cell division protein FtsW (lipid II flippase)
LVFYILNIAISRKLPNRDPYILPIGALLTAWGLLTIFRLEPGFGFRQSIWLLTILGIMVAGLYLPSDLGFLRRYKYLWLTGSLVLTGLTLFLGVNPMGYGPKMWLGCCGLYLQPSEPLKLLLVAYLAGYLADRFPYLALSTSIKFREILGLLAPTLMMTGLAMALLVIQRDLGTASLFFMLFASIVYVASGRSSLLFISAVLVIAAGVAGYSLFDVVKLRVDAWINPWLDPSGGSFQIIQSLMALANGGLVGRGPGLGSPTLVPLAHSDMIFSAIAEEYGLTGVIALLLLFGILAYRGLRAGLLAADAYRSYLAVGLTTYLVGQALVIMAGGLRLLPLTGITLPFVAYGGSSLVTSFIALLLLLHISASSQKMDTMSETRAGSLPGAGQVKSFSILGLLFFLGIFLAAVTSGWWAIIRSPEILSRTDNPRRAITDRWVLRGEIYDRNMQLINASSGQPGSYERRTYYPDLSNIVGYTDPIYGQSGLEASMDGYLRGLEGVSTQDLWWNHLVYGQPPPGRDIRLSIDLGLQEFIDKQLRSYLGAVVLMDAASGEILAMSSSPTFNANQLKDVWQSIISDTRSPLLNRAIQGRYPVGDLEKRLLQQGFDALALARNPQMYLNLEENSGTLFGYSPLQLAWIANIISNDGLQPGPRLVTAYAPAQDDWLLLPVLETPQRVLTTAEVDQVVKRMDLVQEVFWEVVQIVEEEQSPSVTWYVGGTIPGWEGRSLTLVVLIEGTDRDAAQQIGQSILKTVMP